MIYGRREFAYGHENVPKLLELDADSRPERKPQPAARVGGGSYRGGR